MNQLSRREFLKMSGIAATGFLINQVSLVKAQWLTVAQMVGQFAVAVGTTVIADQVSAWVSDLFNNNRSSVAEEVADTNAMMREIGFNDFRDSTVYFNNSSDTYFYNVTFEDGFNSCVPIFVKESGSRNAYPTGVSNPLLVEGPIVMAMYYASRDWNLRAPRDISLIPKTQLDGGNGAAFQVSFAEPKIYETENGLLVVDYQVKSMNRSETQGEGEVRISATDGYDIDDPIFARGYDIEWRST